LILLLLVLLPGCGGCRQPPEKTPEEIEKELLEKKRKEAEKPKPDFEANRVTTRPPSGQPVGSWYKPGHWTSAVLENARANNFDFVGEMEVEIGGEKGQPLPLLASPFELTVSRDIALPKGQAKALESLFFVPPANRPASVSCRLNGNRGGRRAFEVGQPLFGRMPSYQYHFVVLARLPELYGYLQGLDAIRPPGDLDNRAAPFYRVALPMAGRRSVVPAHPLLWTSIAYVLWDDAEPGMLDPAQQQALLDWLHWGGQLILSGPDTLDTLRDSFLAPYLPAVAAGTCELRKEDFAELGAWSGKPIRPLLPVRAWTGVKLQKHPQAQDVPGAGKLLVERRVGRGRIVASTFRLSQREFTDWLADRRGSDEFFNACLLRRPSRKYAEGSDGEVQLQWADGGPRLDARRVSQLRYFTRDTGVPLGQYGADVAGGNPDSAALPPFAGLPSDDLPPAGPGVAAWNDFNPVAQAARENLQNAARIEIPKRSFVLWVVAGYLLVLVPANWAVFRSLGRVEWAWAAAPVVAVISTGVVIRLAQLDIGFARSQTEIAVVELQGDYGRAHVTRYNALYTSLATSYDLHFDDSGAAVLPFPTVPRPELFRMSLGQSLRRLTYRRGEQASLLGFPVGSNSTGLIHSEEMLDLDGGISLVEGRDGIRNLVNQTGLNLYGAGLIRKTASGELQTAWLGTVPPGPRQKDNRRIGTSVPIEWKSLGDAKNTTQFWSQHRDESPVTSASPPPGTLNLRRLLDLGQNLEDLAPGDVRLIAWSDDELPGLSIEPAAPQARRAAIVVAHVAYGFGKTPKPDVNTRGK
jgi:hypothetical protein